MSIVKVTNLKKVYGNFTAVNGISFELEQGEIFGFLGPNGAGKTSTINMLIGLSRPSGGMISIAGLDGIKEIKKVQALMGIVADESNLYPEMDGFANLCFCASLYGMRKAQREKRAHELLKQFNLEKAGKRPFKAYSKGMRRKLTIAAGLIHDPKILFLDEPTTGIDVESARQIRSLILAMKSQGRTVFLTTHYIEEAQRICDRIAFIVNGKIVKTGTVEDLMKNADHKHIIKLTLSKRVGGLKDDLQRQFPDLRIEEQGENTCLIFAPERVALSPILQHLDGKGISVFEAKEVRPSLEDVFLKVTGIEAEKLQKEKEGGKR
jgi:ABC-2 type transport system ATP-binding protein